MSVGVGVGAGAEVGVGAGAETVAQSSGSTPGDNNRYQRTAALADR